MTKINPKTLIIDDEPDARAVLRNLIERYCPQLEICGEADSVNGALESIQRQQPALVFLDVDLPPGTGFDILDAFPSPVFKTVFTTAHDDFALKAYQYRAMHYLLKPIDPQDLIQVTSELYPLEFIGREPAFDTPLTSKNRHGHLLLPTLQGITFVDPAEISYAQSDEKYTKVVLSSGEKIFVSHSMKELEALLPESDFLRPHQSFIVRISSIRRLQRSLGGLHLVLKDKVEIPVSRRNKEGVLKILGIEP